MNKRFVTTAGLLTAGLVLTGCDSTEPSISVAHPTIVPNPNHPPTSVESLGVVPEGYELVDPDFNSANTRFYFVTKLDGLQFYINPTLLAKYRQNLAELGVLDEDVHIFINPLGLSACTGAISTEPRYFDGVEHYAMKFSPAMLAAQQVYPKYLGKLNNPEDLANFLNEFAISMMYWTTHESFHVRHVDAYRSGIPDNKRRYELEATAAEHSYYPAVTPPFIMILPDGTNPDIEGMFRNYYRRGVELCGFAPLNNQGDTTSQLDPETRKILSTAVAEAVDQLLIERGYNNHARRAIRATYSPHHVALMIAYDIPVIVPEKNGHFHDSNGTYKSYWRS